MGQIPVNDNSFKRLSVYRANSVLAKEGRTVTWDNIVSAMMDVADNHKEEFEEYIKVKSGKRGNEDANTQEEG